VDSGDSVFGSPTVWCTQGAAATARLRGVAGYQLAAIGNHDLEHGVAGLRELLLGGYRLVANNLQFADADLDEQVAPAYATNIDGLRIGFTGVTTIDTADLVPRRTLSGVTFLDAIEATVRTVRALEPYVDAIVVLSHLGFDPGELLALMPAGQAPKMMLENDRGLVPLLKDTKVVAILGGHTHDALEPAPVIAGIAVCNAGAYGLNMGEVKLRLGEDGILELRNRLIRQDASVAENPDFLQARERELEAFESLMTETAPMPELESDGSADERQYRLLQSAVRASGKVAGDAILLVPRLYLLGRLSEAPMLRHADVLVAYPNSENLVEMTVDGLGLKRLIGMQPQLMFFEAARPLRLADGQELSVEDVEGDTVYTIVTSELIAEGGLHWSALPDAALSVRSLEATCADLVWGYLLTRANGPVGVGAGR
jgi:2',3'-cyclic-nucleotide 2'-phosphodiesterase (5'-nucleotidase family)